MQGQRHQNEKQTCGLNEPAQGVGEAQAKLRQQDGLEDEECYEDEDKEGEVPCAAGATGLSVLIVAANEGEIHRIEDDNGEQGGGGLWEA